MTVDPRFYTPLGALTLGQIAEMTGAVLDGDDTLSVTGIASAANAQVGDLAFLDGDGKSTPDISANARLFVTNEANLALCQRGRRSWLRVSRAMSTRWRRWRCIDRGIWIGRVRHVSHRTPGA